MWIGFTAICNFLQHVLIIICEVDIFYSHNESVCLFVYEYTVAPQQWNTGEFVDLIFFKCIESKKNNYGMLVVFKEYICYTSTLVYI